MRSSKQAGGTAIRPWIPETCLIYLFSGPIPCMLPRECYKLEERVLGYLNTCQTYFFTGLHHERGRGLINRGTARCRWGVLGSFIRWIGSLMVEMGINMGMGSWYFIRSPRFMGWIRRERIRPFTFFIFTARTQACTMEQLEARNTKVAAGMASCY